MTLPSGNRTISITTGTIVRGMLFLLLAFSLYYFRNLVLVVFTSIVIASFVEAGVVKLAAWRVKRVLAVIIIYAISLSVFAFMFSALAPIVIDEVSFLLSSATEYLPELSVPDGNGTSAISGAREVVQSFSSDVPLAELVGDIRTLVSTLSSGLVKTVSNLFGGIFNLILILVLSFYFSVQVRGIDDFLRIVTPLRHEEYVIGLWRRAREKIGFWIRGQLLLGLIMGAISFAGLAFLGVDYALLISISVVIFELIPFGIILSAVPALILSYIDGGGSLAILVALFFFIIQQIENYVVAPLVINRVVGISPLVVILSVLVGAKAAGFWGLVLAIPVAVIVLELVDDLEKKKVPLRQAADESA